MPKRLANTTSVPENKQQRTHRQRVQAVEDAGKDLTINDVRSEYMEVHTVRKGDKR